MTTTSITPLLAREFTFVYKSVDDIIKNYMPYWTPSRLLISKEAELLQLVKNIINSNLTDLELISWWNSYCTKYNKTEWERSYEYFLFPPQNLVKTTDDMFVKEYVDYDLIRTAMIIHYILGQVYSGCKSYQVLQDYINLNDPLYSPDLIWSTRVDCFTWFNNTNVFADMLKYIDEETKVIHPNMTKHMVLSKSVRANEGRPWVDDFNFFMLPDAARAFFTGDTTVEDHIESMFNKEKHTMLDITGIGSMISHQLWTKLGRQCVFYQIPNHLLPEANIIRPNMDMNICDNTTLSDRDLFRNLTEKSLAYKWPSNTMMPDNDTMYKAYCDLLNH
jgi:hypothetical protein